MFKKKSLFVPALLGCAFFAAVAVTGCGDSAEKKEAPEAEKKMEAAPATAKPDTGSKPAMDTASTRPTKPGS